MAATNNGPQQQQQRTLITYLLQNPWNTVQLGLRSVALVCSVLYFVVGILVSGATGYRMYLNVMLASFITFAMKLHLRMKEAQVSLFSRAFLQFFPTEDSAHYLIYTLLFYNQHPTTIFILPMFLYSVLYTVKFMQDIVQFLPVFTQSYINVILRTIASKQPDTHRFIAFCEVFSFLVLIWKVFTGGVFLLAPFLYYQFLKLRYVSRRNPSVRTVFAELKMSADYISSHPKCPPAISNVIRKIVGYISRLDPYNAANPPPTSASAS